MAGELISPDALKIGLVAVMGAGYAAYKTGLLDKIKAARGEEVPRFRPRPVHAARSVRFEKAVLDICGIDQLQLIRNTAKLRRLGFWVVGDFTLPAVGSVLAPPQKTFARAFVHGEEAIYALIMERRGFKAPPPYVDYFSLFTDLTFLTASNSEEDDDPKRPGALRFHRLPGLLPEELYQHHRANLEALRNNWMKTVPASREAFFSHFRQWLVVDSELRRSRDEEIKKNQISRTVEGLPPLDIGPILKRYDDQRTPFEFGQKGGAERTLAPSMGSPTVIKDPERAPIRRRLPPSGAPGSGPGPMPAAGAVPADPTYGDELIANPAGFAEMAPEPTAYFSAAGEAHPLDLLDQLDAAPQAGGFSSTRIQGHGPEPEAEPVFDIPPAPDYAACQDLGASGFWQDTPAADPVQAYGDPIPSYDSPRDDEPAPLFVLDPPAPDPAPTPGFGFDRPTHEAPSPTFVIDEPLDPAPAPGYGFDQVVEPLPTPAFGFDQAAGEPPEPTFIADQLLTSTPAPAFGFDLLADEPPAPTFITGDSTAEVPAPESFSPITGSADPMPWAAGIPTDPPEVVPGPPSGPEAPEDIRISLRQIQAWRPPDYTQPSTPSLFESAAPPSAPAPVPIAPPETYPDAPVRCPNCRARTLTRYSQRCHKCRRPLLEAAAL